MTKNKQKVRPGMTHIQTSFLLDDIFWMETLKYQLKFAVIISKMTKNKQKVRPWMTHIQSSALLKDIFWMKTLKYQIKLALLFPK